MSEKFYWHADADLRMLTFARVRDGVIRGVFPKEYTASVREEALEWLEFMINDLPVMHSDYMWHSFSDDGAEKLFVEVAGVGYEKALGQITAMFEAIEREKPRKRASRAKS